MSHKIKIKLTRSPIGTPQWMRVIVRTMGLKKMNQVVELPDNGATRGMINKVPHLVTVTD